MTPINYLKDGTDPSVMPDDQYPDWLWNMQVSSFVFSEVMGVFWKDMLIARC